MTGNSERAPSYPHQHTMKEETAICLHLQALKRFLSYCPGVGLSCGTPFFCPGCGVPLLLLIRMKIREDGMLGAAEEAGRSMPHRRVVSLCASDERLFLSPPLGRQTCISEVLMRPSALASSGVSPLFSVLLTGWS